MYCWKAVNLTYCMALDKWGISVLETLCLQMSNRSNDCSNITGHHQECFHKPAKCLHPLWSDSPDCEALAVALGLNIYLFQFFCTTTDAQNFFDRVSYTLPGLARQIVLGLGWQCSCFWGGFVWGHVVVNIVQGLWESKSLSRLTEWRCRFKSQRPLLKHEKS